MNKYKNLFLGTILLGLVCVFMWSENEKVKEKINRVADTIDLLGLERDLLLDNSLLCYAYNGKCITDFSMYNIDGDKIMFSELLDDEYKLMIKFLYLHCSSCINTIFDGLNKMVEKFPKERVIIIGEYENKRTFEAFRKNRSIPYSIYWVNSSEIQDDILKEENMPYSCLINESMKIENILIPIKELPDHSARYYGIMFERFFK